MSNPPPIPRVWKGFTAATLDADDYRTIRSLLARPETWLGNDGIDEFQREFARIVGVEESVSFFSGRMALYAILRALDVGEGDEVALPAFTCVVVPNAVRYLNALPAYADIELDTYGVLLSEVERALTPRTKALIVQHTFGIVSRDFEALLDLARSRRIAVIEDCAHATGASFRGRRVGTFGDAAFFSLEQSKIITSRMGGVAVSRRADVTARLREIQARTPFPDENLVRPLLLQTLRWRWEYHARFGRLFRHTIGRLPSRLNVPSTSDGEIRGYRPLNYPLRMSNPMAEMARVQLRKMDSLNQQRRQAARHWERWATAQGYPTPLVLPESDPVFLRYPIRIEPERKRDRSWGRRVGAPVGDWFVSMEHPRPLPCPFPNAMTAIERCVNLPTL